MMSTSPRSRMDRGAIHHFDEMNKSAKGRPDLVLMDLNLPKRTATRYWTTFAALEGM